MRVLVAPQEYKGTLTAIEAGEVIAAALRAALPDAEIDLAPMADGGPGTTAALIASKAGRWRRTTALDPLMRPVEATWGVLPAGVAVLECASASGILRLPPEEYDPRRASTFGTGQLIASALEAGCRELILGLGGSATNDGGAGMAQALGFRLLDATGIDLEPGGAALTRLARIDGSRTDPRLRGLRVLGATDVTNPLCGPDGASAVYGTQKGADAAAIAELDAALRHFAAVIARDLGVQVLDVPGAGAAGGLGAGAIAFLGAELRSGAAVVGSAARMAERVGAADIVVTGEGRLDHQTPFGKSPAYVAGLSRSAAKPVLCIAGSLGQGAEEAAGMFDALEVLSGGGGVPSAEESRWLLGEAAVRGLTRLGFRRSGR